MALKPKSGGSKPSIKRSTKSAGSSSAPKAKKKGPPRPPPTQHKPKPTLANTKKKPPHLRYTEKELRLPQLNGIRPAGVQKLPNKKKGKHFVDDGDGMRTILALVMAEKEGNIESKMMRARQLEEIREAKRVEAEKRVEGKRASLEEKKSEVKRQKRGGSGRAEAETAQTSSAMPLKKRKKVSFG